ncbi:hypothetical protein E5288_WYG021533 [Bos mutus]|uniref:Uncharacterized protein n=1 Tax=Bos mutus TaxID=72004 RepID=A0A6B0R3U0_9CETA|nr:hypothetical protein [Bos mutus]
MRGDSRLPLYVRGAGAGPDPRRRRRLDNCRARPQVTRDRKALVQSPNSMASTLGQQKLTLSVTGFSTAAVFP